MNELLKIFCMDENEATSFLEKTLDAKNIVNKLTGLAQTEELYKLLSNVYNTLDEILSPICLNCKVKAQKFITSPAQLFDPAMADLPGGTRRSWTGEWFCPKCNSIIAYGEKWWGSSSPNSKISVYRDKQKNPEGDEKQ